jgi:urease accessory protein
MQDYLPKLLHMSDPTLPIGGFSHSSGLETYVQLKIVKDAASTELFVRNMLANNLRYNDAAFVRFAYEACMRGDSAELVALDQECAALKAPAELKQASRKLGVRQLRIFERHVGSDLMEKYALAIGQGHAEGYYPIVYGLIACLCKVPVHPTVYSFLHTSTVGMITNAVKLVPLGQISGQDILFRMYDVMNETTDQVLKLDRSLLGVCNIGFDIRCMQHERLYSRLYMS